MRAELPWNVAGIPPEAREAARAAARRDGLSVGEWLTRRILRSFSDLGDEPAPFSAPSSAYGGAPLDSWGLPQSSAARRDSEEMLARVSRSESESTESWRRIEEQLRGVGRRLDSSERSQSENNRVISRTAAEMNVAAREQAQAFDQMGQTIMVINDRLERLEREKATDGVKDAVKALHQGLSRLADQMGQTATHSAAQVTAVTQNLDQLAHRLGQTREDAEHGDNQLSQKLAHLDVQLSNKLGQLDIQVAHKLGQIDEQLADRFNQIDNRLAAIDTRVVGTEKTAQFTTNAIDHALEKLEAQAQQRATDQVEQQRRAGQTEEALQRLEDSVIRLEQARHDPALERRLDGIETSLHGLISRLETYNPTGPLEETIHTLARRLDDMDKSHASLVNEMRANIMVTPKAEPVFAAPAFAQPAFTKTPAFEAPPLAEPPAAAAVTADDFLPPYGTDAFAPDSFATGAFTETADLDSEDPFAPLSGMVEEPGEENFLAAARRNVREAAEKSATAKPSRFRWNKSAAAEGRKKPGLLVTVAVLGGVAALAVAAAVVSQRLHHAPSANSAAANGGQPFTAAPQVGVNEPTPPQQLSPQQNQGDADVQNAPPPSNVPQPPVRQPGQPQQQAAGNPPQRPAPGNVAPPTLERAAQLAAQGNPTAQTLIGIRAQGGSDGSAANPAEALKWLSAAAAQGQPVAQYRLGTLYERGQGVAANAATAAGWYVKAANAGNRLAMYNLAVALANKSLGRQDMPEAARWFARAAALGLTDAQFNLAVLYERGDGVPQNLADAYKWYLIAAAAGDNGAAERAKALAGQNQLSDVDRAAATKSAQAFKATPLNRAANVPPELADLAGQ
jgi:localization factor PodJL